MRRTFVPVRSVMSTFLPIMRRSRATHIARTFTSTRTSRISHDFRHSRTIEDDEGSENEAEFYRKHDEQYSVGRVEYLIFIAKTGRKNLCPRVLSSTQSYSLSGHSNICSASLKPI